MNYTAFLKTMLLLCVIFLFSCRKDFSTTPSHGNLQFSTDTLFLDTVFNNLSTTTKVLKIYNTSKKNILIPSIQLEKKNSKYRLNVDGVPGTSFTDVLLLKKDSLFIFVEGTISVNETNTEMIYDDKILFDSSGSKQTVNLVTLVKDATFLYNSTSANFELTETTLTNTKPYVIYGNAIIPKNKNLTINAGTILYFHKNSSLSISEGASLNILGTLTDSVVFKGDNLNYEYNQVPGQWQGITIDKAAEININFTKIINPTIGLTINNSHNVTIQNTEIYNAAKNGIHTQEATITANNVVVGQAGESGLYLQGGSYIFSHGTFANYWNKGIRSESTLSLSNYYLDRTGIKINSPLTNANFTNCIVTGNKASEIFLDKSDTSPIFNFNFKNSMLKLKEGENSYDTNNFSFYTDVILNKNEDFKNSNTNDFRIGIKNEGINKADKITANKVPLDIIGTDRTIAPDIGAYQHIDFKTLETEDE